MMTFERLNQRTTPHSVVDAIRSAILDGSLAPGAQLREEHIARDMGISRAPLREALQSLEREGLVTRVAFRGAFVAEVGADQIREIESLRERLEPYAVDLAIPALKDGGRDTLARLLKELRKATRSGDIAASIDAHLAVHRIFYELANHRMLLDMWRGWEAQLRLFLAVDHQSYANLPAIADDHDRLLTLVDAGDRKALLSEVVRHVQGSLLVGTPLSHARSTGAGYEAASTPRSPKPRRSRAAG